MTLSESLFGTIRLGCWIEVVVLLLLMLMFMMLPYMYCRLELVGRYSLSVDTMGLVLFPPSRAFA